jgi:uncharacterized BrkB/YihY/UPF0761 family membrane protein
VRARERATAVLDRRVPDPVQRFGRWLVSDELFTTGSSLAFYALLSLPPMVLIGLWVVGGFVDDGSLQSLGRDVEGQAPEALPVGDVVRSLVDVATQVGWLSILAAVWPATAYGAALGRAFTAVAPESERSIRGWRGRLLSLAVIALLPLLVFVALAVFAFGPSLLGSDGILFAVAAGAVAVVAFTAVVALIFTLYQLRDTTVSDVLLGAALASAWQVLVTGGYVLYLTFLADFEEKYGRSSLTVVVLLGLWLLLSNAVLLISYRWMLRRCDRRQQATGRSGRSGAEADADEDEDEDAGARSGAGA